MARLALNFLEWGGFSQREAKLNLLRLSAAREPKAFSIHAGFKSN